MRTSISLFIHVAAVLSVMASPDVRAQDPWASWKPSVGDKFVYAQAFTQTDYWHGGVSMTFTNRDTLTIQILNTDSSYNAQYDHVVTVWNSFSNSQVKPYKHLYYYHAGANPLSKHPFAIDDGDSLCSTCTKTSDFSIAKDIEAKYQTDSLGVYSFVHDSEGVPAGYILDSAEFSSAYKWLTSWGGADEVSPPNMTYTGYEDNTTLISATTLKSKVEGVPDPMPIMVTQSANLLIITLRMSEAKPLAVSLLDPIGRKVRFWQMPTRAGVSQIMLNIAGIPTGAYFLMLEAPGISDVRKIAVVR